ncbi:hypothetical protein SISSUDRAFT_1045041 [Sistotremastrum suecicum HHB10207 ss-3]|uniref:Uncharacterized protein n=1 Tax=Sistotremastrum suecicum HHB10207 ss-3 TaxID=1314776 RepID=A0A166ESL3_9AGAM|nr:hypothetical protein SISSUDRAFT_1045041 [Sistotremastrum suecicum HHB10207 ss-3]
MLHRAPEVLHRKATSSGLGGGKHDPPYVPAVVKFHLVANAVANIHGINFNRWDQKIDVEVADATQQGGYGRDSEKLPSIQTYPEHDYVAGHLANGKDKSYCVAVGPYKDDKNIILTFSDKSISPKGDGKSKASTIPGNNYFKDHYLADDFLGLSSHHIPVYDGLGTSPASLGEVKAVLIVTRFFLR